MDQSGTLVRFLVGCTARAAWPRSKRDPCDAGSVTGCTAREAERENPLPNTRLKLPAPGRGKNCVCAPAGSVVVSSDVAPAGSRRRSLSAIR